MQLQNLETLTNTKLDSKGDIRAFDSQLPRHSVFWTLYRAHPHMANPINLCSSPQKAYRRLVPKLVMKKTIQQRAHEEEKDGRDIQSTRTIEVSHGRNRAYFRCDARSISSEHTPSTRWTLIPLQNHKLLAVVVLAFVTMDEFAEASLVTLLPARTKFNFSARMFLNEAHL